MKLKHAAIAAYLALATLLPLTVNARHVAYRGFVDIAPGPNPNGYNALDGCNFSTTHGLQMSSKYFLGVGASAFVGDSFNAAFFIRNRFDITNKSRWTPYIHADLGVSINPAWLYLSEGVGIRYSFSKKVGLNIGLLLIQSAMSYYDDYYDEYSDELFLLTPGINIGIDF